MQVRIAMATVAAESTTYVETDTGREILIFSEGGQFHAYSGICPHLGGPLRPEMTRGHTVTCPWHAYVWNLRTGACESESGRSWRHAFGSKQTRGPFSKCLQRFAVRIDGNDLVIEVVENPEDTENRQS